MEIENVDRSTCPAAPANGNQRLPIHTAPPTHFYADRHGHAPTNPHTYLNPIANRHPHTDAAPHRHSHHDTVTHSFAESYSNIHTHDGNQSQQRSGSRCSRPGYTIRPL